MTKAEFLRVMERDLDLPSETLRGDEGLADIRWDSMSAIVFMALSSEVFGKELDPKVLEECKTISDLMRLVGMEGESIAVDASQGE